MDRRKYMRYVDELSSQNASLHDELIYFETVLYRLKLYYINIMII